MTKLQELSNTAFKRDFKKILRPLQNPSTMEISGDLTIYDYSDVTLSKGHKPISLLLGNVSTFAGAEGYYAPQIEAELTTLAFPAISQLSPYRLDLASLGTGVSNAVKCNEFTIGRALDASAFWAFDVNSSMGKFAAHIMKSTMESSGKKITSRSFHRDFTKTWPVELRNRPIFFTMIGETLAHLDTREFFAHFNRMTDGQAVLYFTADCRQHNPLKARLSAIYREFKENKWKMLKTVAGDELFAPAKIEYHPREDEQRVYDRYLVTSGGTTLMMDGEIFPFRQGVEIVTGHLNKNTPENYFEAAKRTGSEIIGFKEYDNLYGFFLIGNKFPHADVLRKALGAQPT